MTGDELTAFGYDAGAGAWLPRPGPAAGPALPDTFGVATFNVWFGSFARERRARALLEEVRGCDADVIAFQEVTAPFLELLLETPWVRDGYVLSDRDGSTYHDYGVVMLSRIPPVRFVAHDLPTFMGRRLLVAELDDTPGASLAVASVHLESLRPSEQMREVQFARIVALLAGFDHAVLMGDMNFCASWDENARVPPELVDVWPHLHPHDPGYTEDTYVNAMLRARRNGAHKQVRFDRVFLRSAGPAWRPAHIERLGTRPVGDDPQVFPSDHFGLHARFTRG